VNQHRSGTPLLIRFNSLIHRRKSWLGWGHDRRRSGPHHVADFCSFPKCWLGFDRGPTWALIHRCVAELHRSRTLRRIGDPADSGCEVHQTTTAHIPARRQHVGWDSLASPCDPITSLLRSARRRRHASGDGRRGIVALRAVPRSPIRRSLSSSVGCGRGG
jgi:hypothetical protein